MNKLRSWTKRHLDKVTHNLTCLVIAQNVAMGDVKYFDQERVVAAVIGWSTAMCLALAKEAVDYFCGGKFDAKDLMADVRGATEGTLLFLIL